MFDTFLEIEKQELGTIFSEDTDQTESRVGSFLGPEDVTFPGKRAGITLTSACIFISPSLCLFPLFFSYKHLSLGPNDICKDPFPK